MSSGFGKATAKAPAKKPAAKKPAATAKANTSKKAAPATAAKAAASVLAGSSESKPEPPEATPEPPPLPKPPTPPPEPEPVIGQVKVRYSHYCKSFTVTDGVLQFGPIDSEYCISFVFKGAFGARLALEEPGGGRVPKLADGAEPIWAGPLSREEDEEGDTVVVGTFGGVEPEQTYQLFIEEDEGAEAAARAAGLSGTQGIRRGNDAGAIGGVTSGSAAITAELKGLSVEELREQGEKYKALLEARDLEDCLYGSG